MKKHLQFFTFLLLLTANSFAQNWLPKADISKGKSSIEFEKWLKLPSQKQRGQYDYMYFRRNTPAGLRDLVSKTASLLEIAKKGWDDVNTNDITLPKYVENMFDYQSLPAALEAEDASVIKIWEIGVWDVMMQFRRDYSLIYITKR